MMISVLFLPFIPASCDKEDNVQPDKPQEDHKVLFTIEAYFNYSNNPNKKYPDVGASVYIYFNVPTYTFSNADYLGNGIYNKRGKMIEPDSTYSIDGDGCIDIEYLNSGEDITIIVESYKMYPVYSFHLYSPLNPPSKIIVVFTIPEF